MRIKSHINYNVELAKLLSICLVVIYHISVAFGVGVKTGPGNVLLSCGGFLGVTAFLFFSGYNIYGLLGRQPDYLAFIIGRWKKLSPHYYVSLIVSLLFTSSVAYLSLSGIINIFSHFFYFHNLFYSFNGAINGVAWTLGVIFQFYLLAPLLKKAVDRFPRLTFVCSLTVTIALKYFLFMWLFPKNNAGPLYYFIYGGQIFTSIDIFVLGMVIAKFHNSDKKTNNALNYLMTLLGLLAIAVYLLFVMGYKRQNYAGINTNTYETVYYLSGLALLIGVTFIFFNRIRICDFIKKAVGLFNSNSYAFYIWHLLILNNIAVNAPLFKDLFAKNYILGFFAVFVFLYIGCMIINVVISPLDLGAIVDKIKNAIKNNKKTVKFLKNTAIICFCVYISFVSCRTIVDSVTGKNTVYKYYEAYTISENCLQKMKGDHTTYLYVDTEETGYFNYYHIKYCMASKSTSVDWINNYIYVINYGSAQEFMSYIKSKSPDYIIVKENKLLESNGYKINKTSGSLFTFNENATDIKHFLSEVV